MQQSLISKLVTMGKKSVPHVLVEREDVEEGNEREVLADKNRMSIGSRLEHVEDEPSFGGSRFLFSGNFVRAEESNAARTGNLGRGQ